MCFILIYRAGDNGKVVYSITSGDDDHDFEIAQNGTVMTRRLLDRESRSLYNLVVTAYDQAQPPSNRLSSTVQVNLLCILPSQSYSIPFVQLIFLEQC